MHMSLARKRKINITLIIIINSEAPYYTAYKVIQQYRYLREYCYKRGIKLINATKGGILIELERKDLEDIL